LHCSVFGFGFGFILKPNRLTEQPMYNSVARKSRAHSREHTLRHSPDPSPTAHHGPSGHQAILANPTPHPAILSRQQRARGSQAVSRLAAAATAVAVPTPARLRFRLPLLPRVPRSGEFAPPHAFLPEPAAPTASARRGETGREGILGSVWV